ncbi:g3364 [Coccomyxa elongata]
MSLVQPDHIILEPDSTTALCWLVRHWSRAKVLKLQLDDLSTLWPVGAAEEDFDLACWEARDVVDRAAGLSCLRALHISPGTLYNISSLTQLPLQHLQLEVRNCIPVGGLNKLRSITHITQPQRIERFSSTGLVGCPVVSKAADRQSKGTLVPAVAALAGNA